MQPPSWSTTVACLKPWADLSKRQAAIITGSVPENIVFKATHTSGGQYSKEYCLANMLLPGTTQVYSTTAKTNTLISLSIDTDTLEGWDSVSLTEVTVTPPPTGYTAPVQEAVVVAFKPSSKAQRNVVMAELEKSLNDCTEAKFKELKETDDYVPLAWVSTAKNLTQSSTVKVSQAVFAKDFALFLVKAGGDGDNIDIANFSAQGVVRCKSGWVNPFKVVE